MRPSLHFPYRYLKFSYLFVAILLTTSQSILAETEPTIQTPYYPYPTIPLHLQNESKVVGGSVRPNVMLFIDNSGSMNDKLTNSSDSKLNVTKRVLKELTNEYNGKINWGLQTLYNTQNDYCYGRRCNQTKNYSGFKTDISTVQNYLSNINAYGGTPTTRRYYEVQKNMREYIAKKGFRCQDNIIIVMSDGDANSSCDRYTWYFGNLNESPFGKINKGRCLNGIGGMISTTWDVGNGLQLLSKPLSQSDLMVIGNDVENGSWQDPLFEKQVINTYTIGFGEGISPSGDEYLKNGAAPAPGIQGYFDADNEKALKDAFNTLFEKTSSKNTNHGEKDTYSYSMPASTSTANKDLGAIISLDTVSWSSNIKFIKKSTLNNTGFDNENWVEPSYQNRKLIINFDDQKKIIMGNQLPDSIKDSEFGLSSQSTNLEAKNALLPWFMRSDKQDSDRPPHASFNYRKREAQSRNMGDILNSSLVSFGAQDPVTKYQKYLVTAANDGMLYLFQRENSSAHPYDLKLNYMPISMQRDGKNDRMISYLKDIANERYGRLSETVNNQELPAQPHVIIMDSGISARQTPAKLSNGNSAHQQAFVVASMGQGGRGIFALNVGGKNVNTGNNVGLDVDERDWINSIPLFESSKEDNQLGYTVGVPQVARIYVDKSNTDDKNSQLLYAVFIGNGYDGPTNSDSKNALYIYNILGENVGMAGGKATFKSGDIIKKIVLPEGKSLAQPTVVDIDGDEVADIVYAGDYEGNLWRFDLRNKDPNAWNATKIFKTQDGRPITSAPAVSRRGGSIYVVTFGTGSTLYQSDLEDTKQNTVYGIFDDLNQRETVQFNNLVKREFSVISNENTQYRIINPLTGIENIADAFKGKDGWYINLGGKEYQGERVVMKPQMGGKTAFITTNFYSIDINENGINIDEQTCYSKERTVKNNARSWLLNINVDTGDISTARNDVRMNYFDNSGKILSLNGEVPVGKLQDVLTPFSLIITSLGASQDGDFVNVTEDKPVGSKSKKDGGSDNCIPVGSELWKLVKKGLAEVSLSGYCPSGVKRISWKEIF